MTAYAFTRLVHILVAILGMGSITASAVLARPSSGVAPVALRSLGRLAGAAMGLMLVSGLLLDYFASGAFHRANWFRLAMLATIASGIAMGYARRAIGQVIAGKADRDRAMGRAAGAIWVAVALVAFIVVLMVRRPFA
ncbi:MAG: hypothetical protein HOV81_08530 [Kofleriaceae bacterium]|nr:hypothetical protein [Kofleriaceae bacterium]